MYNDWNSCSHCYLRQPGKNHHQYEYKILNEYTYAGELKNELDARQMRGTSALTLELIRKEFTDPLSNQLTELSAAIGDLQGRVSGNYNVLSTWQGQGTCTGGQSIQLGNELHFFWDSDDEPRPRCLPQYFLLDTSLSPLLIWQHWHHGLTLSGNRKVRPLKRVPTRDCPGPQKERRKYEERMKIFCKAIDTCTGIRIQDSPVPDIAALGTTFLIHTMLN